MLKTFKQIFKKWFDSAVDDDFKIIIPYKYRNFKIIKIIIVMEEEENEHK